MDTADLDPVPAEAVVALSPLRRARLAADLSMEMLAALAGVSMQTVWRAEKSQSIRTSERTWRRLAEALGVSVSEIRGHDAHGPASASACGAPRTNGKGAATPA